MYVESASSEVAKCETIPLIRRPSSSSISSISVLANSFSSGVSILYPILPIPESIAMKQSITAPLLTAISDFFLALSRLPTTIVRFCSIMISVQSSGTNPRMSILSLKPASRSSSASSIVATAKRLTPLSRSTFAQRTLPCPYASAFTTPIISLLPITLLISLILWSSADRSISTHVWRIDSLYIFYPFKYLVPDS